MKYVQQKMNAINIYLLNIMKQQEESNFSLPKNWYESLHQKYGQMTNLQLKKQKIIMVKDLEEINILLDQVITVEDYNEPKSIEQVERQIQKNKRMQKSLQGSLQNFEFMLTGDYSVKADEQIKKTCKEIKFLREEISKFNRMLQVPMQKDIQICQNLQKQLYCLEKEVVEGRAKNMKKKEYVKQLSNKISEKAKGILEIGKQIEKQQQQKQLQNTVAYQVSIEDAQKYKELLIKKDKLESIVQKDEKRYMREFSKEVKKLKQIEEAAREIEEILVQIGKSAEQKKSQLQRARERRKMGLRRHRNSDGCGLMDRKIKTQHTSEVQSMYRVADKRSSRFVSERGEQVMPRVLEHSGKSKAIESQNLLPRLYKVLGKSKLNIEQDCNIRDLIYM